MPYIEWKRIIYNGEVAAPKYPRGFLAVSLIGLAGVAAAAPAFIGLRVGFAGRYKVGVWTPVKLTILGGDTAQTGSVRVTVLDDEGVPSRFTAPGGPYRVEARRETSVPLYVRFGRPGGSLLAEFLRGDEIVARRVFEQADQCDTAQQFLPALETNQALLLVIGSSSTGIAEAIGGCQRLQDSRAVVACPPTIEELPAAWYGYEGVDRVIVATGGATFNGRLASDAPQLEALDAWIRQGGRLLVCAGSQAEQIVRPESPWSRFLPGRLKGMVELRQTGQLETYAGSAIPVPLGVAGPDALRVPHLIDVEGVVELCEADLPLVVRSARGFGEAVFLATDLDQPPLLSWKGRRLLIRRLLDQPSAEDAESGRSRPMMHQGFLDTAGQLRKSLNRFDGIRPTPFWMVVAMLLAYVVLIGPLDYYLVRRVARRMVLTWVTFPLMIVAVSATACFLAWDLKGDKVRLHQVDVVDVDATAGLVRGTSWAELFSPRADTYNLAARPVPFRTGTARAAGFHGGTPRARSTFATILVRPGRHRAGWDGCPDFQSSPLDRALRVLAALGPDLRSADAKLVHAFAHGAVERPCGEPGPCGITDRRPVLVGCRDQRTCLPAYEMPAGLRPLVTRPGHVGAGKGNSLGARHATM